MQYVVCLFKFCTLTQHSNPLQSATKEKDYEQRFQCCPDHNILLKFNPFLYGGCAAQGGRTKACLPYVRLRAYMRRYADAFILNKY